MTTFVFALVMLVSLLAKYVTPVVLEWPEKCKLTPSRHYCRDKPRSYPNETWIDHLLQNMTAHEDDLGSRDGSYAEDIAKCRSQQSFVNPIYAIKDENDVIWYVPQTEKFRVNVETFECRNAGRVTDLVGLESHKLLQKEVHCREWRVAYKFPVLSQDLSRLENMLVSPKDGLPLSCSAKVLKKN